MSKQRCYYVTARDRIKFEVGKQIKISHEKYQPEEDSWGLIDRIAKIEFNSALWSESLEEKDSDEGT